MSAVQSSSHISPSECKMANSEFILSEKLDLSEPPQELLEYAALHIGERPELKLSMIQDLRNMIAEKKEFTSHRTDNAFLIRFLRARSFRINEAYKLLAHYYKFRENNPKYFKNINPIDLTFVGEDEVLSITPYREQTGRRILIIKIGNWKTENYTMNEFFQALIISLELGVLEQRAQILGGICIFDFEGITMQHAKQITPWVASTAVDLIHKSLPLEIHAIHIVNQSKLVDVLYQMVKPLLSKRERRKVFFHKRNTDSLHQHIHPQFLPIQYGGDKPNQNYKDWLLNACRNKDVVKEIRSLGYVLEDKDIQVFLKHNNTFSDTVEDSYEL